LKRFAAGLEIGKIADIGKERKGGDRDLLWLGLSIFFNPLCRQTRRSRGLWLVTPAYYKISFPRKPF
jgi:hypothetical protein